MENLTGIFRNTLRNVKILASKEAHKSKVFILFQWPNPRKKQKGVSHGPFLPISEHLLGKVQVDLSLHTNLKMKSPSQCSSVSRF